MSADQPITAAQDPPLRTAIRLAGLGGLIYAIAAATHPGDSGRHLAGLVLILTTAIGWGGWLAARHLHRRVVSVASLCILAVSGGALVVLTPVGVGVVALATLVAATMLELAPAAVIAGLCLASTGVAVAITGHTATVIANAAAGAAAGLAIGITRRQVNTQAEHEAQLSLEQQRSALEHDRADILEQRTHIAREVHDVLAHTLSALSVQMEALDSLLDDGADTTAVRDNVQRARRLVVEGLDETRRAVRALRDEPVAVAEQVAALARDDGAGFQVYGEARPLPPAQGLALLRIAQEALTNARKHAPGAHVSVVLTFTETAASLTVDNAAPQSASPLGSTGGGYGLRGMRERVELLGGTLTSGLDSTGWRVRAHIPT